VPHPSAPDLSLPAFSASLPESYRRNFAPAAVEQHATLARDREGTRPEIGIFTSDRPGTALCVIADDRPGLLATISAALVLCDLDVIEAEAYTRRVDGAHNEAVDVFWVRYRDAERKSTPLEQATVERLRKVLADLIEGKLATPPPAMPGAAPTPTPSSAETVVRFIEGDDGSFTTLEVETGDRSGLLLLLSQALFKQRVQIISSQVKTVNNRVFDRFSIVELDGASITPARRLEIQVAVLTAIDPILEQQITARTPSTPPTAQS
jgi:[protein-PII] uridylyltransferase